jgi:DNA-directed RNA polymerase subunit L
MTLSINDCVSTGAHMKTGLKLYQIVGGYADAHSILARLKKDESNAQVRDYLAKAMAHIRRECNKLETGFTAKWTGQ